MLISACYGQDTTELWGTQLLTSTISIWLPHANLQGTIPTRITRFVNLSQLNIAHNFLVGALPSQIGLLTQLNMLNVSNNRLIGPIPDQLGRLSRLVALDLSHNELSGRLPTFFAKLPMLSTINLHHNMQLAGQIMIDLLDSDLQRKFSVSDTEIGLSSNQPGVQRLCQMISRCERSRISSDQCATCSDRDLVGHRAAAKQVGNLVANPGFENLVAQTLYTQNGVVMGAWTAVNDGTLHLDPAIAPSGTASYFLYAFCGFQGVSGVRQNVMVTPGVYTLSVTYGGTACSDPLYSMLIRVLNQNGQTLVDRIVSTTNSVFFIGRSAFITESVPVDVPTAGSIEIGFFTTGQAGVGSMHIDDVSLVVLGTQTPTPTSSLTTTTTSTNSRTTTATLTSSMTTTMTSTNSRTTTITATSSPTTTVSPSNTLSNTITASGSGSVSQSSSLSQSHSVTTSPTVSPSALPSLVFNLVIDSAVKLRQTALDTHPGIMVISTTLSLVLTRTPLRPLSHAHLYATAGPENHKTVLLKTVPLSPESPETILEIENIEVISPGTGILAIGVEAETGMESTVDYAWIPLEDWALPPVRVSLVSQSVDVDNTPLVISAVVAAVVELDLDQQQLVESGAGITQVGAPGARLYLIRETTRERLALIDEITPVEPGSIVRFDALQCNLPGPRDPSEVALGNQLWAWEVVVFNKAFESSNPETAPVFDETGLSETVATVVATASVAVVASTITSTASTASAVQVAQVGASAQGGGASAGVSPVVMINNLQGFAMTGSIQLNTIPRNYRSFATSMSWINGNIGITPARLDQPPGPINIAQEFRSLQADTNETAAYRAAVVAAGSTAPQLLYDTLVFFVSLFLACAVVLAILARRKPKPGSTRRKVIHKIVIGAFGLAYFGLTVAATLILWTTQGNDADKMIGTLILLLFTVPFPMLGLLLYRNLVSNRTPKALEGGWSWTKFEQVDQGSGMILQAIAGETRRGCEWYGLLGIYRRLLNAVTLVLLMDQPAAQCGVVLALFLVSFLVNLRFRPFKGGLRSMDSIIEAAGQIVVIATCAFSLVFHFAAVAYSIQRVVGQSLVILQMCVIAGSLFFTIVPLFRAIFCLFHCKSEPVVDFENPSFSSRQPTSKLSVYESPRKMRRKQGREGQESRDPEHLLPENASEPTELARKGSHTDICN